MFLFYWQVPFASFTICINVWRCDMMWGFKERGDQRNIFEFLFQNLKPLPTSTYIYSTVLYYQQAGGDRLVQVRILETISAIKLLNSGSSPKASCCCCSLMHLNSQSRETHLSSPLPSTGSPAAPLRTRSSLLTKPSDLHFPTMQRSASS